MCRFFPDRAAPDDRPSFLFNGVTNNSQQGGPVPLVFGTHLVGSVVINAGLNAEDIPYVAPPQTGGRGTPRMASHTRDVPSRLAVTTRVPSGLNAAAWTAS